MLLNHITVDLKHHLHLYNDVDKPIKHLNKHPSIRIQFKGGNKHTFRTSKIFPNISKTIRDEATIAIIINSISFYVISSVFQSNPLHFYI